MIKKRHLYLTEEILKKYPEIGDHDGLSINIRQEMQIAANPRLGQEAAQAAIKEWGQPTSKITHLVFSAIFGGDLPSADYQLIKLMGLSPNIKRVMLYNQGCFTGGTTLRVAKDLAENNAGARVLVVCSDLTISGFRGPSKDDMSCLVGHALFGDGAAAMIVGADPVNSIERPIFTIISTLETLIPNSGHALHAHVKDVGISFYISPDVPYFISNHIEDILVKAFSPLGINDWNSIFWALHPGGRAILDKIEEKLKLKEGKIRATRTILAEYGNMMGACVIFVLDEMRKKSMQERLATTGEGLEWGVLLGFGPGLTVETVVLRSEPIV